MAMLDPRAPYSPSPGLCVDTIVNRPLGEVKVERSACSNFTQGVQNNHGVGPSVTLFTPAPTPATSAVPPSSKKFQKTVQNFTSVDISSNEKVPLDPFLKPVGIPPPATLREARLSPWWPQYQAAMDVEFQGHLKNGTWELVEKSTIPFGKNLLRGKWVFDDKRGENGKIIKFKARYVAMGFTQKKGIDFNETFAGVVVAKSFRTMLIILNENKNFEMEHWDVKMAFTQAELAEELFMYQPECFEKKGSHFVCKLKKSLYGLKQAAKNWGDMLGDLLVKSNFSPLHSDPCVYILKRNDAWCVVSTHVDDIFALFNEKGKILKDDLFQKISSKVEIENLGPVSWALKTLILRDRENGVLKISQEAFITDLLNKYSVVEPKNPQLVPTHDALFLPKNFEDGENVVDENLKKLFQSQIGALWWLTTISRPDIYYGVHRCSKMINKPTKILGKCIMKILLYLSCTKNIGIVYQRKIDAPVLSGFVDASFASEDENFLSRIGYFYLFRGNLVSWVSENPSRVMTSSTESECRGLVHFSKENLWHRQFHQELSLYPILTPTTVFEDNTSSITMSNDLGLPHKRSKHFGIEFSFFKQSVVLKEIFPVFISTEDQPADMLTKTLHPTKFTKFRDMVMGGDHVQKHFDPPLKR